jgi:hypothetical protein
MRRRPIAVALASLSALVLASCHDAPTSSAGDPPLLEIRDAVHNEGNEHFFWLSPLVGNPAGFNGDFDAALSPVVQVCDVTDCENAVIAQFTTTAGPGAETVRADPGAEHYIVSWHTDAFDVDDTRTYRIRALLNDIELGFADLDVVTSGRELRNVNTGEYIALLDGRTLPIRFRIEEGALAGADLEAPVLTGLSFTPTEVDVSAADQQVTLSLTVTDVGTGVAVITVQVDAPGTPQTALCTAGLTSGDAWAGEWTCVVTIPRSSEPGLWSVSTVSLSDVVSNVAILSEAFLQQAGFPTKITVID